MVIASSSLQSYHLLHFKIHINYSCSIMPDPSRSFWTSIRFWSCFWQIICMYYLTAFPNYRNTTSCVRNHWFSCVYSKCNKMFKCLNHHFWTQFLNYIDSSSDVGRFGFLCCFKFFIYWSFWCFAWDEKLTLFTITQICWCLQYGSKTYHDMKFYVFDVKFYICWYIYLFVISWIKTKSCSCCLKSSNKVNKVFSSSIEFKKVLVQNLQREKAIYGPRNSKRTK